MLTAIQPGRLCPGCATAVHHIDAPTFLITVATAARLLSLGRTKTYELIEREGLPVVRFGRSIRVNPVRLREWLSSREDGA